MYFNFTECLWSETKPQGSYRFALSFSSSSINPSKILLSSLQWTNQQVTADLLIIVLQETLSTFIKSLLENKNKCMQLRDCSYIPKLLLPWFLTKTEKVCMRLMDRRHFWHSKCLTNIRNQQLLTGQCSRSFCILFRVAVLVRGLLIVR